MTIPNGLNACTKKMKFSVKYFSVSCEHAKCEIAHVLRFAESIEKAIMVRS